MLSAARISIWFFIGISLLVNGGLILATGIYELTSPPQHPVTLFNLHASIWWGGLLFLLGSFYSYHFAPVRAGEKKGEQP
jgi:hypothetical protein